MDNRAVSPVVEKTIAVGLVALFVSGLGTTLLGGVVPAYEASAGETVGERALAKMADSIEASVPDQNGSIRIRTRGELPGTLAGESYQLELSGQQLRLLHPDPTISTSTRVALPGSLSVRNSSWPGGPFEVRVSGPTANRTLRVGGT